MIGLMLTGKETEEVEYLLKRELEQILNELSDDRLDSLIQQAMEERYKILFRLYKRFAKPKDILAYLPNRFSKTKHNES